MMKIEFLQLFSRSLSEMTAGQIIRWWETRRFVFNGFVGLTGLAAGIVMFTTGAIMEAHGYDAIGIPDPPIAAIFGIFLYAVIANICYTVGWLSELGARQIWPAESSAYGKIAFALGLVGSVILTAFPAILTVVVAIGVAIAGSPRSP
jgi:hypothetical protein